MKRAFGRFFQVWPWRSTKTRVTLFTLAIFVNGIWSLAFYASRMLSEDMQRMLFATIFLTLLVGAHTGKIMSDATKSARILIVEDNDAHARLAVTAPQC